MITKTIKYVDYNGVERTESFQFNLTKAELMEMELSEEGGLAEKIQKIIDTQNMPEIIKVFKDLVLKSYGMKSDDGRRFIKNDKMREEFQQTEAYSDLFMELATDADKASEFISGIIPAEAKASTSNSKPEIKK